MPNWCDNSVTLRSTKENIDALEKVLENKEDQQVFQHLHPRPATEEENWYNWNIENWGTKWDISVIDWSRYGDNEIWISFDTAWAPPIGVYQHLHNKGWSVEAFYHESGMCFCGQWVDGEDDYYEYDSDDLKSLEALPNDLQEFTGLIDYYHDREAEREQEEHDAKCTEWFDGDVKPVHVGRYEAKDINNPNWPFAEYADWDGKKWVNGVGKKIKVHSWRGLKENPDDVIDENNLDGEVEKMMNAFGFKKV